MRKVHRDRGLAVTLTLIVLLALSCTNEFTRASAPVELIATNAPNFRRWDLAGGEGCDEEPAFITMENVVKNDAPLVHGPSVDPRFNDVRVTRYRVSYARTDGGTAVPAPFVRATDVLIPTNGSADLPNFVAVLADSLNQAPFASLKPENGGRDPETGRQTISMEVIVDLFGETLAGSNVVGRTRFPLDFCFMCQPTQGCD